MMVIRFLIFQNKKGRNKNEKISFEDLKLDVLYKIKTLQNISFVMECMGRLAQDGGAKFDDENSEFLTMMYCKYFHDRYDDVNKKLFLGYIQSDDYDKIEEFIIKHIDVLVENISLEMDT